MNRRLVALGAILTLLPAAVFAVTPAKHAPMKSPAAKTVKLPDGLQYVDLKVGQGAKPAAGQTAVVHYTGTLTNGTKFDSSRDRNQPFEFVLGRHEVIPCWDEGVSTMRVGGRRKLVCPPALAYGEAGRPPVIPQSATLNFDVELLGVK